MIRVLVADDHPLVREGLRTYLALQDDMKVVAEAADGAEAVAAARELLPDVALMDVVMPVLDGIEATRQLAEVSPATRVIVLTSFIDDDKLLPAVRAGAMGYLLKDVEPPELVHAIRTVHAGEALLDSAVTARVLEEVARAGARDSQPASVGDGDTRLTPREREVLGLLAHGLANKAIAYRLGISEKTVKAHVSAVLAKLGLSDRTQAALYAVRTGVAGRAGPES